MKKIKLLIAFVAFGTLVSFQNASETSEKEINWMTLEEAIKLQEKEPKKIIMDVYTNWCGPCKMLDKYTFHNEDVVDYVNEHFYAVKFNGEGNDSVTYKDKTYTNPRYDATKANRRNSAHELTRFLNVRAYPTMVFFDENGDYIAPISGYLKPRQIELYLKMFKTDKHKEMTTQEKFNEYYKNFEPTFKE
ncbi:MAG: thioredoxin family protein [Flavobacteriaceae bacterium]|nr:thioredoxin family protein [Flavobacteriaceae bacterium]MBD10446.1 thioredoxin family protein [Flavobacteriaceae bacterium]|tara:strand:+ start:548 stop:1117 length:570 start_codon:yes stop_codon:yes gene_type:complete